MPRECWYWDKVDARVTGLRFYCSSDFTGKTLQLCFTLRNVRMCLFFRRIRQKVQFDTCPMSCEKCHWVLRTLRRIISLSESGVVLLLYNLRSESSVLPCLLSVTGTVGQGPHRKYGKGEFRSTLEEPVLSCARADWGLLYNNRATIPSEIKTKSEDYLTEERSRTEMTEDFSLSLPGGRWKRKTLSYLNFHSARQRLDETTKSAQTRPTAGGKKVTFANYVHFSREKTMT